MKLGKLLVTLQSERRSKDFVERKIEVKEDEVDALLREYLCQSIILSPPQAEGTPGQGFVVTQFHYEQWPEHDRPPNSAGLLNLVKSLNDAQRKTGNKPVTVMCK